MRFLHAALGNPTQATLLTAAQHGNLVTFPGMTPQNISRHFPESDETQKGHMKQMKQGVRSTKIVDEDAMLGVKHQPGVKHKDVYLIVFDATKKSMFSDQTGKFPITSACGNKYIMVAVVRWKLYRWRTATVTVSKITHQGIPNHFPALEGNWSHLSELAHTRQ